MVKTSSDEVATAAVLFFSSCRHVLVCVDVMLAMRLKHTVFKPHAEAAHAHKTHASENATFADYWFQQPFLRLHFDLKFLSFVD